MLIKIKPSWALSERLATPEALVMNRRGLLRGAGAAALASGLAACDRQTARAPGGDSPQTATAANAPDPSASLYPVKRNGAYTVDREITPERIVTGYNNYYEFGVDKDSPSMSVGKFNPDPWTVTVSGECNKKAAWHMEDILKGQALEDRIYRHRCVERWSMVIPWVGFPLSDFIKKCEPTSKAKYVKFTTLYDPKQMPGRDSGMRWPYVEGLRMDEAMHPLTILTVGLYGEVLPKQNGAPLRLAVPWKYGFKHVKSIVKIEFVEKEPLNTWQEQASNEYGFYANVNPAVDHPRWSQAQERRIGEFFMRKTMLFNGYGDQVASLYSGMDLRRYY